MPNRRARTRRKKNIIIDTISTKAFIITSIIMLMIILACIATIRYLNIREIERVAKEKERINAQIEEIYTSANAEIASIDTYKTNSIIRLSAVGDILLGNNLREYGKDYNNIFTDISKYFKDSDFVIGTYETVITNETKEFADAVKKSRSWLCKLST